MSGQNEPQTLPAKISALAERLVDEYKRNVRPDLTWHEHNEINAGYVRATYTPDNPDPAHRNYPTSFTILDEIVSNFDKLPFTSNPTGLSDEELRQVGAEMVRIRKESPEVPSAEDNSQIKKRDGGLCMGTECDGPHQNPLTGEINILPKIGPGIGIKF